MFSSVLRAHMRRAPTAQISPPDSAQSPQRARMVSELRGRQCRLHQLHSHSALEQHPNARVCPPSTACKNYSLQPQDLQLGHGVLVLQANCSVSATSAASSSLRAMLLLGTLMLVLAQSVVVALDLDSGAKRFRCEAPPQKAILVYCLIIDYLLLVIYCLP